VSAFRIMSEPLIYISYLNYQANSAALINVIVLQLGLTKSYSKTAILTLLKVNIKFIQENQKILLSFWSR